MKIPRYTRELRVAVRTPLRGSEDPDKVRFAIENVIGSKVRPANDGRQIEFFGSREEHLYPLYESIRKRRTLAVARRLLLSNSKEGKTRLLLNKQAAFIGTLVLCENEDESPLGPIELIIETDDLGTLIDWLSGET
ncbi:MAG: RNA-binding domain-containing protein [Nitrososphaerales archaeon]